MQRNKATFEKLYKLVEFLGVFAGLSLAVGSLIKIAGFWPEESSKSTAFLSVKNRSIELEVARTPAEQERGLAYRRDLTGKGMLFPVHPPNTVAVWMKNVEVPLDIAFVRQARIVAIAFNAPPCRTLPCPTYSSPVPVDAVIELPAGEAEKLNLFPGATIAIRSGASAADRRSPAAGGTEPF